MNKGILGALLGVLSFGFFSSAYAFNDDAFTPGTTHATVDAGFDFGGDKLVTAIFTDGSTKTLHAGDGLFTDVGMQHNFDGSDWSFKGTLGIKYNAVRASNATISFTRYPLDLLALYSYGRHHFGAGLAYDLSPKLDMSGFGQNADFNSASGFIVQYQYWLFGVRYTNIKYHVSNCPSFAVCKSVDGSSFGLFFNYVF